MGTGQMRGASLSDFDDADLDIELESAEGRPPPTAVHVFDPAGGEDTADAFRSLGLDVEVARLGSMLMSAANDGRVAGVVVAANAEPELRELFLRAFRSKFPAVPVLSLQSAHGDAAVTEGLLGEGASGVLPWPLPPAAALLPTLTAHFPHAVAARKGEAEFSPVIPEAEAQVLARKLAALEAAKPVAPAVVVRADAFEAAVRQVAEQRTQNTELRSELTIVRDRNKLLEDRIDRLKSEVESLTRERDSLLHGDEPSAPTAVYQELLGGVESYSWAMEAVVQFLEDLKLRVGNRAPSLDVHLRTVRLVKQLVERLSHEARGGDK